MLSSTHTLILESNRDRSQVSYLARQMFPNNSKLLIKAYEDAIHSRQFGHLLLDHTPNLSTFDRFRISNFVFPFIGSKYYISDSNSPTKMSILRVLPETTFLNLVEQGVLTELNTGIESLNPIVTPETEHLKEEMEQEQVTLETDEVPGASPLQNSQNSDNSESLNLPEGINWITCEETLKFENDG
jgi:hypothetical protein